MQGEAESPSGYKYTWPTESLGSFAEYLTKYRPSQIIDDGNKPWIWARNKKEVNCNEGSMLLAIEECRELLEAATAKIEAIQGDPKIPLRGSAKTGTKSKKEVREEIQSKTEVSLRAVAEKHEFTVGKWLCFARKEPVDRTWEKIAKSLVEGGLSRTTANTAKVSTTKRDTEEHVICVYFSNVFDKDAATEVLSVMMGELGIHPTGVKPDLYTYIGLDSKHKSGIRSTVWQPKQLLTEDEIKGLQAAYSEGGNKLAGSGSILTAEVTTGYAAKHQLRPRDPSSSGIDAEDANPFASDSDENDIEKKKAEAARRTSLFKPKAAGHPTNKNTKADLSSTEDEDEEAVAKSPPRKVRRKA